MTEIEDRLRRVLEHAAQQLEVESQPWRGAGAGSLVGGLARWAPRRGSLLAAAGAAVAVAVAVVALVAGSAHNATGGPAAGSTPPTTSTADAGGLFSANAVLAGNGVGPATFGQPVAEVSHELQTGFGAPPQSGRGPGECGLDGRDLEWRRLGGTPDHYGLLALYFRHGKLVGYSYAAGSKRHRGTPKPGLTTQKGLLLGATMRGGRHLYGKAFHTSTAQGGSWSVKTRQGKLIGYAFGAPRGPVDGPLAVVASIEAGDVGCPAMTP
jgi:hypothetical protein